MTEDFRLDIERTGVIKHMSFNLTLTWETKDEVEETIFEFGDKFDPEKYQGPVIVLKDGIVEWMQENLENNVYGRCKSFEVGGSSGGPELLFGSEADRSLFVLKWL